MDSFSWAPFVCEGADKTREISRILQGDERSSKVEEGGAAAFKAKVESLVEPIHRLDKHCRRSKQAHLLEYIRTSKKVVDSFYASPDKAGYDLLEKHSLHASRLLNSVVTGKPVDRVAREILKLDTKLVEAMVDHDKFIRALEKNFKVKVQKSEPINQGVFVYFDPEDTQKMGEVVKNSKELMDNIVDDLGYLLLRRGVVSDIDYGPFGESLSCWLFVYAPVTPQKDDAGEVLSKHAFKTLKLKQSTGSTKKED